MSELEVGAVARDVAELYEPVAEEQGIALEVSTPEPIQFRGSRELLGQALANLIDNAIKYGAQPDGAGKPRKILVSAERAGNELLFRVADNGPGIPERDRGRVVQRFVRLEESRSQPGSGLGLSLVAAVAHLHHGSVELGDGNPGLVVTVRLPIEFEMRWPSLEANPAAPDSRRGDQPAAASGSRRRGQAASGRAERGSGGAGGRPAVRRAAQGWEGTRQLPRERRRVLALSPLAYPRRYRARYRPAPAPPAESLARLVASTASAWEEADEAELMRRLRRTRQEAALLVALADLGGVWDVVQVTQALSDFADAAVSAAVKFLLSEAHAAGEIEISEPTAPDSGSGFIVLGMGKLGAGELNYSSDIDLIVLYDREVAKVADPDAAPVFFVRLTKRLVHILQERTVDGYVFRTDLRLRPDPGSTSIAISTEAALQYYEGLGQNWERAALIKARPSPATRRRAMPSSRS